MSKAVQGRRLLVVDVEGTIFEAFQAATEPGYRSTMWHQLAQALGPEAVRRENATHDTWAKGGYSSYIDWVLATVEIHRSHGLERSTFEKVLGSVRYQPGIKEALGAAKAQGWEIILVSGGFRELAARAQRDLGIVHAFAACEYLFDETGRLVGVNVLPSDFEAKLDVIRLFLKAYGVKDTDWAFIGDGRNDVAIASAAPLSIAYRAEPELERVATYAMEDFSDLPGILATHDAREH